MARPPRYGPRFDRSFLAIAAAMDGLGVALESLLLAERELASGWLVRPLLGRAEDGHRAKRRGGASRPAAEAMIHARDLPTSHGAHLVGRSAARQGERVIREPCAAPPPAGGVPRPFRACRCRMGRVAAGSAAPVPARPLRPLLSTAFARREERRAKRAHSLPDTLVPRAIAAASPSGLG